MRQPLSSLTAGALPPKAKELLALLALTDCDRVTGYWKGRGKRFSLGMGDVLKARGLARQLITGRSNRLEITAAGRMLIEGLEQRRKRA